MAILLVLAATVGCGAAERPSFDPEIGAQLDPDRPLRDSTGAETSLADVLAGKPALVIFGYDKVSSGASSDIQYATQLARDMVTRWGMSDALGPLQYAEPEEEVFLGYSVNRSRQMSNETAQAIDKEIRKVVEDGYERAKHLLDTHRDQLEALAQALLEYETLSGEEIKKVLDGETIGRGGIKGPSLPSAGSSIPKAKRPKAGAIGGPAAAGA